MSLNQFSSLFFVHFLIVASALAQPAARLEIKAPRLTVLVARTLPVTVTLYAESGAVVTANLEFSLQPAGLASVTGDGVLRGLAPGIVTLTARDSSTGASGRLRVEVRPLRIELEPSQLEVRMGETSRVSALAIDADGRVIPNQSFRFATGLSTVATISNAGAVLPVAEGVTSIVASINGTSIAGTGTVRVLRKSDYRLTRLQDSRISAPSAIQAVHEVTAAGTRVAYLATLANGGQAAVMEEGGRRRVLLTAGQYLPAISRLVLRMSNISINARGDAAVFIEHASDPWCVNSIVIVRASGSIEEPTAACGLSNLHPHGLAENGDLTYQVNSGAQGMIRVYAANGATRTILSMAEPPAEMAQVPGIYHNGTSPSRFGHALVFATNSTGGEAWHYNGQRWQRVVRVSDTVDGSTIQFINQRAFGGADGRFYTRFGENGILQMAPGQTRVLTKNQTPYANGVRQSWSHNVVDVLADKVLINANLVKDDKDLTYLAVISGDRATTLAETNWIIEGGGFLADGRVAAVVIEDNELRPRLLDGTSAAPLFPPGTTVDAPALADWVYPVRGGSSRALVMRGAGESLVEVGSGPNRVLAASGARLPGTAKPLIGLSAVASSSNGTVAFVGSFPAGHGIYLWRNGELSMLIDTVGAVKGPGGAALGYLATWRNRLLAVNNRGEAVFWGNSGGVGRLMVIAPGEAQARAIATLNSPLLGGLLSQITQVAIDDEGRVSFLGTLSGRQSLFFWDKARVELIAQPAASAGNKPALTEFFSLATSGREHYALFNYNWEHFEVRSYDGARWAEVTSTSDARAGNLALRRSYGPSQLSRTCYFGSPNEGTVGAFCAQPNGKVAVLGRLGDRLPGGGTMLAPIGLTVAENGEIYLAAQVYENGREFVALYLASPL